VSAGLGRRGARQGKACLVHYSESLINWAAITLVIRRVTLGKQSPPSCPSPHTGLRKPPDC
jgi:hypothetical protein